MLGFFRSLRRKRLARRAFPKEWEPIISEHFSRWLDKLDPDEQERVRTHLKVFVWEKYFIGAKGLKVTDEVRVVIAGQAARLSRNLSLDSYDRLTEVIVYPSHYKHPNRDHVVVYGEAHTWGTVVLSWDAVTHGLLDPYDERDTSLHEFAHVLDIADGVFDGTPILRKTGHYRQWSRVLGKHFGELLQRPSDGIVREYGAQNAAEFFAVATEAFFERPKRLRKQAPDLYRELERFYDVHPD